MNWTGQMNWTGNMKRSLPLLALTALLVGCTPPGDAKPEGNDLNTAPAKTTVLNVQVVTANQGTLRVQRSSSAIITAQKDSQVATQSGGTVTRLLADEGEQVGAGAVVVQLDDTQQRQALENARLQVQQQVIGASYQLAAFRDAAAMAKALGRILVLPKVYCWCDSDNSPTIMRACHFDGAELALPFRAPGDLYFNMDVRISPSQIMT